MTAPPGIPSARAGLCERCRHTRIVETRAGSRFYLCQRSQTDPAFPRYPRLPVLRCRGFDAAPDDTGGGTALRPEPGPR